MAWGNHSKIDAIGIDSNPKCACGTATNLQHLFSQAIDENAISCSDHGNKWALTLKSDTKSLSSATIYSADSAHLSTFISEEVDCVVTNLPWNRNTFEFQGSNNNNCTNIEILKESAAVLKPGCPLVVVSGGKRSNNEAGTSFNAGKVLKDIGFCVLGEASIPPEGFILPGSGKKRYSSGSVAKPEQVQRSSDCIITVAVAPHEA